MRHDVNCWTEYKSLVVVKSNEDIALVMNDEEKRLERQGDQRRQNEECELELSVQELKINNTDFIYQNQNEEFYTSGVDFNDISIKNLN